MSTRAALAIASVSVVACVSPDKRTLADLQLVEANTADVQVENGLDEAMEGYRRFLAEAPESTLTPEAMRRLADLKLEKEYGILGGAEGSALPAPSVRPIDRSEGSGGAGPAAPSAEPAESDRAFERRAAGPDEIAPSAAGELALEDGTIIDDTAGGPLEAIALYDRILETYPNYRHNDRVLYQKARAFDELGRPDEAIAVTEQLIAEYPYSRHIDEVWFRRGEYFFTRRRYLDAEEAYSGITRMGPTSEFYELALYKLGWALYKQDMHEEALDQYIALLDHKVSNGYDFDQASDEDESRRIADTFRVVSLSFSIIGGPDAITAYFAANGPRTYEDRVYRHLGEFYFEKLRYQDAASAYEAFVALHPHHRSAPHFGIRVVEIYEAGGFPKLVLASKKDFAARYDLGAEYWQHFPVEEAPEIVAFLNENLRDLANHYHAAYQDPEKADEAEASFAEAKQWYHAFLTSFAEAAEAPVIHNQLAGLLLEHEDFGEAAYEYERTAYDYPPHEKAAEAGYAAIYAHREHQKRVSGEEHDKVREAAVASTLRFVDVFPEHEHAAVVLGAAIDDLYEMERYDASIEAGRHLLASYPDADTAIVRSAWLAIGHSAFGIADYPQAEQAYAQVLELTDAADETRQAVVDNLAASIYKQAELANEAQDYRAAADHFLRIAQVAPESKVRPAAEFDAGAALMRLEAWDEAVAVLDAFRQAHPDHELSGEATKQLANLHRRQGDLELAAVEYERIAEEDEEARSEALLEAGELYEEAGVEKRAIAVYETYVEEFPEPLELAVETRFKMAALHDRLGDADSRFGELRWIVDTDRSAGAARTDRIRYLAARSALVLTEGRYDRFVEVKLTQPFERSLAEKKRLMSAALSSFGSLVDYEVGEVTAAATFYMAETYRDFSEALLASERPTDLPEDELLDYEEVLEEEAFPFEEKAIAVHEKNLELMSAGVYNGWIEKSLAQLGKLMPGRYAKFEESSGLIESVNRYAYQVPHPTVDETVEPAIESVEPDPAIETIEPAPGFETVESTPGIESVQPAAAIDPVEPDPAIETVEPAPGLETVESTPGIESVQPAAAIDPAEPDPAIETVEPTPGIESVQPAAAIDPVEPAPAVEPEEEAPAFEDESVEPVDVLEIGQQVES